MDVIYTDIYPTRYAAFDAPGRWVIFKPINGKYRSCRADGTHLDRSALAAGIEYPGEMAIMSTPGLYVEVGGNPDKYFWGATGPRKHYRAVCQSNESVNKTFYGDSIFEVIELVDEWLRD